MPMNPRLLRPTQGGFSSPDADARAYLAAVRIADGSNLEPAVAKAISDFIIGCKADGIWSAIKASCILMGAKTLSGALTPLVGGSPTNVNNNFVSGDYNRKTGLVGNGSTKYLDSNRANNADPQNSKHMAVYVHTAHTSTASGNGSFPVYIGADTNGTGASNFGRFNSNSTDVYTRLNNASSNTLSGIGAATGLVGASRAVSASYTFRSSGSDQTVSRVSQAPSSGNIGVFQDPTSAITQSNARLQFYSIGESINLGLLDTRLTALMTAIGAAI